jgi:hypothetical protein
MAEAYNLLPYTFHKLIQYQDLDSSYARIPRDASPHAVTDTPEQMEIATPDLEADQKSSTLMTSTEYCTQNPPARSPTLEPQGYNTIPPRHIPPPIFA